MNDIFRSSKSLELGTEVSVSTGLDISLRNTDHLARVRILFQGQFHRDESLESYIWKVENANTSHESEIRK
jgi:hypothetical protein